MPARARRTTVTCTLCAAIGDIPDNGDHTPLWEAGWRWIGLELVSCPACPQVVVVDQNGRHRRGPGAMQTVDTPRTRDATTGQE